MPGPLDHGEGCHKIAFVKVPDGYGGTTTKYQTGDPFVALIDKNSSATIKVAQQTGFTAIYTVSVLKDLEMEQGDLWYRDFDGQIFRTTSNPDDEAAPEESSFDFKVFEAEKTEIDSDLIVG